MCPLDEGDYLASVLVKAMVHSCAVAGTGHLIIRAGEKIIGVKSSINNEIQASTLAVSNFAIVLFLTLNTESFFTPLCLWTCIQLILLAVGTSSNQSLLNSITLMGATHIASACCVSTALDFIPLD